MAIDEVYGNRGGFRKKPDALDYDGHGGGSPVTVTKAMRVKLGPFDLQVEVEFNSREVPA